MQYLTIWDLLLTPIYIVVLSAIARRQRDKRYPVGHPLRPYYMKGLYLKFGGAVFIGLVYQYYYGGGDTFNFFRHSQIINSALADSVQTWVKLLLQLPVEEHPELYAYTRQMPWYGVSNTYTVAITGAVAGLLCGTTYMPIALLFAYFSYTGIWAMYRTFASIYPQLYRQLAIAFLFIPSTIVWGSALFKDTICMFSLGWMTYTVFRVLVNRDFSLRNILLFGISFYLVFLVKVYILVAFVPALAIWLFTTHADRIDNTVLRQMARLTFVAFTAGAFFWLADVFAEELQRYSLENIVQTANATRGWISYVSEKGGGAAYNLGEFEPTFMGMLRKAPEAIIVTLFRPFLWETGKLIILLSALESLLFGLFTLRVLLLRRPTTMLRLITTDATLVFCLVFTLIFAFAVGITSYNFGALSRYKIPCLPFFAAFLIIVYNVGKKPYRTPSAVSLKRPTKVALWA